MNKILYEADSFFLLLNCPEEPNFKELKKDKLYCDYKFFSGFKDSDVQKQYDEALKSCERIQIQNPEVLPWYFKGGDLFPIPEGIEWEIKTVCENCGVSEDSDCDIYKMGECDYKSKKLAILKLKSQPDWKEREAMQEMMRGREPRNVIEKIMLEVKGESQERILCAAIWYDDGNTYMFQPVNIKSGIVVSGLRHPHCKTILRSWLYPNWQTDSLQDQLKIEINSKEVQGFITSSQRFVDRKEAAKIFVSGGNKLKYSTNDLYSEDLY